MSFDYNTAKLRRLLFDEGDDVKLDSALIFKACKNAFNKHSCKSKNEVQPQVLKA